MTHDQQITHRNHFLSRGYLKRWATEEGKIWEYKTLVPHSQYRPWKLQPSLKTVAYKTHLYTNCTADGEDDSLERHLAVHYDGPAALVLDKVQEDISLSQDDWEVLLRFAMAQRIRTPAALQEVYKIADERLQDTMNEVLEGLEEKLGDRDFVPDQLTDATEKLKANLPFRVNIDQSGDDEFARVSISAQVGRQYWLASMQYHLARDLPVLQQHHWSILKPPLGHTWDTSDRPFMRLHYNNDKDYNFEGGMECKGVELIMPLTPNHLLYTKVGDTAMQSRYPMNENFYRTVQRMAHKHALRSIFSKSKNANAKYNRPPKVSREQFNQEKMAWAKWHQDQTDSQRAFESRKI